MSLYFRKPVYLYIYFSGISSVAIFQNISQRQLLNIFICFCYQGISLFNSIIFCRHCIYLFITQHSLSKYRCYFLKNICCQFSISFTQKQPPELFYKKAALKNFEKFTGVMVSFCRPQTCNFIEKETLARVFSFEFCEIFKEHLWTTAAAYTTYVS